MIEIEAQDLLSTSRVDYLQSLPSTTHVLIWFSGDEAQFSAALFHLRQRFPTLRFALDLQDSRPLDRFVERVPFWILQRLQISCENIERHGRVITFLKERGAPATLLEIPVLPISENEILEAWRRELWPERQDPIRAMSSMIYPCGIDMSIYKRFAPSFFGAYKNGDLIGVISGHRSSASHFRSRGLWVHPACRRQGIALSLLRTVTDQARAEKATLLWSHPRLDAVQVYERAGFQRSSAPALDVDHCYAYQNLERTDAP